MLIISFSAAFFISNILINLSRVLLTARGSTKVAWQSAKEKIMKEAALADKLAQSLKALKVSLWVYLKMQFNNDALLCC